MPKRHRRAIVIQAEGKGKGKGKERAEEEEAESAIIPATLILTMECLNLRRVDIQHDRDVLIEVFVLDMDEAHTPSYYAVQLQEGLYLTGEEPGCKVTPNFVFAESRNTLAQQIQSYLYEAFKFELVKLYRLQDYPEINEETQVLRLRYLATYQKPDKATGIFLEGQCGDDRVVQTYWLRQADLTEEAEESDQISGEFYDVNDNGHVWDIIDVAKAWQSNFGSIRQACAYDDEVRPGKRISPGITGTPARKRVSWLT